MHLKLTLLAASGLLALSACGVYQDYPNDETAIKSEPAHYNGYYHENRVHSHHPSHMRYYGNHYHSHDGHVHTHTEGVAVGEHPDSYMENNEDKWMYNSCPPGAAKRGDC